MDRLTVFRCWREGLTWEELPSKVKQSFAFQAGLVTGFILGGVFGSLVTVLITAGP